MSDWVTVIEHHAFPHRREPKIQIDIDSIKLVEDHSFSNGVNFAVEADIKRIGLDGKERVERRKSKDWIAVALAWKAMQIGDGKA